VRSSASVVVRLVPEDLDGSSYAESSTSSFNSSGRYRGEVRSSVGRLAEPPFRRSRSGVFDLGAVDGDAPPLWPVSHAGSGLGRGVGEKSKGGGPRCGISARLGRAGQRSEERVQKPSLG